jgi:hypothetical protein
MLIEEFFQAVANYLRPVVTQPITQAIKLIDEVVGSADS